MKVLLVLLLLALALTAVWVLRHPAFGPHPLRHNPTTYENEIPTPQFTGDVSMTKALWDFLTARDNNRVPKHPIPAIKTNLTNLPTDTDWIIWFGHSSYLFQLAGLRVLVDPLLRMEFPASMMMRPFPGTDISAPEDIPEVDLLVITHEHWDHMDYATLRDLRSKVHHVVCPLGIAEYLVFWGYSPDIITEMNWYEKCLISNDKCQITCLPTRHFSNRLFSRNHTLWASFMVECGARRVYIGGDGGYDDRFRRIHEQFGTIDLAIMENGQYNTQWANIHMLPEHLEQAMLDLQADQYLTVHHDKFALARHPWQEPDSVAQRIAEEHHLRLLDTTIGSLITF